MKRNYQIDAIISILIGLLLIFIPTNAILNILQFILGFCLIIIYLPTAIISFTSSNMTYIGIKSLIFTILGFVIVFFGFNIIGTVIGVIMLTFLFFDLINANNKRETFKKDLVKYIISIILIFIGVNKIIDIIVLIAGLLLVIGGIIKLAFDVKITNKQNTNSSNGKINEKVIDAEFEDHEE